MRGKRIVSAIGPVLLLMGAGTGCAAGQAPVDELPSYSSLEDARQAVFDHLECREELLGSTVVFGSDGPMSTESVKCTPTVELFYFDSQEARTDTYAVMADAAESGGSVYFAEGRNWFVVDYSEVEVGSANPVPIDLSVLSESLGTRFTEVK